MLWSSTDWTFVPTTASLASNDMSPLQWSLAMFNAWAPFCVNESLSEYASPIAKLRDVRIQFPIALYTTRKLVVGNIYFLASPKT
jgi:hypothetical protein